MYDYLEDYPNRNDRALRARLQFYNFGGAICKPRAAHKTSKNKKARKIPAGFL
jgi:hypothetical protein